MPGVRCRSRALTGQRGLEALDARQQRRGRRVDLRGGGLDEHQLQLDPRLGAVGGRLQSGGDEVQQAHDVGAGQRLGLGEQPLVALGGDAELLGHLLEHLDRQQLAAVDLEVAQDLTRVAAGGAELGRAAQGGGGVVGDDRVQRLEQLLGVGHAQHGQDVGGA